MEAQAGRGPDHFHLRDVWKEWDEGYPDLVVVAPDA